MSRLRTGCLSVAAVLHGALISGAGTTQPAEPDEPSPSPTSQPAEVRKLDGVSYLPAGRLETMWLRIPADAGPDHRLPAILIIPGGGWANHFGSKYVGPAERLARWGYVVAVIDYQIVTHPVQGGGYLHNMADSFPQNVHDCKTAVRFLRKNAAQYGIDPERIGVLGASAGGHLAALVALTRPADGLEPQDGLGDVSSAVQACVTYYGAHDWSTWGEGKQSTAADRAAGQKASTINYVDQADPPMLVIHGDRDRIVPVAQSRKLAETLTQAGATVAYWEVPGVGHSTCLVGKIPGEEERLKGFLDTSLKNPKR